MLNINYEIHFTICVNSNDTYSIGCLYFVQNFMTWIELKIHLGSPKDQLSKTNQIKNPLNIKKVMSKKCVCQDFYDIA